MQLFFKILQQNQVIGIKTKTNFTADKYIITNSKILQYLSYSQIYNLYYK